MEYIFVHTYYNDGTFAVCICARHSMVRGCKEYTATPPSLPHLLHCHISTATPPSLPHLHCHKSTATPPSLPHLLHCHISTATPPSLPHLHSHTFTATPTSLPHLLHYHTSFTATPPSLPHFLHRWVFYQQGVIIRRQGVPTMVWAGHSRANPPLWCTVYKEISEFSPKL